MLSGTTAIDLTKRLEDELGLFFAESTSRVYYREFEHDLTVAKLRAVVRDDPAATEDLPLGGEFDSVPDNIEEYLADSNLVSLDP